MNSNRLSEILDYSILTGKFYWKEDRGGKAKKGVLAGHLHKNGYRYICIDSITYRAHRLAFLLLEGTFPVKEVDHINRIKDDNSWINLRHSTRADNLRNRACFKGYKRNRNERNQNAVAKCDPQWDSGAGSRLD